MKLATLQAPGQVTYQTVVCPVCGATLQIGYQALAPQYLIANATCPFCGTVVAHNAVSVTALSGPAYTTLQTSTTGTDWTSMITAMMPMLMMIMMMAIMVPMMKGMTGGVSK